MIKLYLTGFFSALGAVLLLTPLTEWISNRFGAIDLPHYRKIHSHPKPRWGGLAIAGGVSIGLLSLMILTPRFRTLLAYRHKFESGTILSLNDQLVGILVGAFLVLLLGMIDDKKDLPGWLKFPWQIIAALMAMVYGIRIFGLNLPFIDRYIHFPILLSQLITILWIVGFMNAINLSDGLDGMAAGLATIVSATFLIIAVLQGDTKIILFAKQMKLAACLSAVLCGACLGFLFFNFNPARLFMGDGGSLFIGFLLGSITVIGTLKSAAMISLFIPILVIALPVTEVVLTIVRRLLAGRPVMLADRGHIHHRLLDRGWSQKEIVLLTYVITLILAQASILLTIFKGKT